MTPPGMAEFCISAVAWMSATIEGLPAPRQAEVWCILNTGEWPVELEAMIEAEPWLFAGESGGNIAGFLMVEILNRVGIKSCLQRWNADRLTPAQFDAWWACRYCQTEYPPQ